MNLKIKFWILFLISILCNCKSGNNSNNIEGRAAIHKSNKILNSKTQDELIKTGTYYLENGDCELWISIYSKGSTYNFIFYNQSIPIKLGILNIHPAEIEGNTMILFDHMRGNYNDYDSTINIQNYGNSLNEFEHFDFCDSKYLAFKKFDPKNHFISKNKLEKLNNLAFYFEKSGNYQEAVDLLESITQQFPNRVVAYLNLADAYWGLDNEEKAKENYRKYVSLMKSQKKDLSRIPKRVYDRVD